MSDALERERWERMWNLHEQYERMRAVAAERKIVFKEDSGTAAALQKVFGKAGSFDNAWWTTWRPEEDHEHSQASQAPGNQHDLGGPEASEEDRPPVEAAGTSEVREMKPA
jgi:hypothetical protein